ncbi:MAG TPA: hypothetical protein VM164_09595 [Burkholderiales bacterium]|nr:hypothetical protein [Burkholderiales bacterium]
MITAPSLLAVYVCNVTMGFAAGGPTDVIARVLAQQMTTSMGQTVIV